MDNPLRGVVLMLAATLCFSTSDAMSKYLGRYMPVIEIGFIRYVVFVVLALALMRGGVGRGQMLARLHVRGPALQILRGLCLVGSALLFILGLRYLPLADASSVGFLSPMLITMLSGPLLGETIGPRRWVATGVGFIGVLVIARPGTGAFQPAALVVMSSSLCWALGSVLTRRMTRGDEALATLVWTSVSGLVVLSLALPFVYVAPGMGLLLFAILLGAVSSAGQYLMLHAYRAAPASLLAPFTYIQLIYATTFGYLFFDTLPDAWTFAGAGIIIASGIYTARRERLRRGGESAT
ncbi:MAG: DMT family transporter [Rhodospirillales bacterium]|nr:DMT family transporter [Rhodospirillales bacterium]MDE2198959.1 DMT family transporter [Rhodospirillales bacterium]MDE2574877.1 DMT family transporter [Rhodospirillales bacterium]